MITYKNLIIIITLVAGAAIANGQTDTLHVYRANVAIVIDGRAMEGDWNKAPVYKLANPYTGMVDDSIQSTTFRMLYDDQNIYGYFEAMDKDILGKHTVRDAPTYEDDVLELFLTPHFLIDSFYFGFEMNCNNTLADFVFFPNFIGQDGYVVMGYNPVGIKMSTAIHGTANFHSDTDSLWTLEFAIPHSAFVNFNTISPIAPGSTWKGQVSRWDHNHGKSVFSSLFPTGARSPHIFSKFGYIFFRH